MAGGLIAGADWPLFGWIDDVRPALAAAMQAGRACVLATLCKVEGSAPRSAGVQMLFDGGTACGFFSGDCIEGDVARHAADVLASGEPRVLVYGAGSPWIDIRLRCGGALHIFVERIAPDCGAARQLLAMGKARVPYLWVSDGRSQAANSAANTPLLAYDADPPRICRRYDPARRLIITGSDPVALALAQLAVAAQFETWLIRRDGPADPPPIRGLHYMRDPIEADRWSAFIGATHEDGEDLATCIAAARQGAAYVGMIGAKARAAGRRAAMRALGGSETELAMMHLPAGMAGLGKSAWEVAVSVMAEVMQAMNASGERG